MVPVPVHPIMDQLDVALHGQQQQMMPDHRPIAHTRSRRLNSRTQTAMLLVLETKTILINQVRVSAIYTMLTTSPNH